MSLEEGKKAKILFSVFSFFSHYIARLIFNQKENNGAREEQNILAVAAVVDAAAAVVAVAVAIAVVVVAPAAVAHSLVR